MILQNRNVGNFRFYSPICVNFRTKKSIKETSAHFSRKFPLDQFHKRNKVYLISNYKSTPRFYFAFHCFQGIISSWHYFWACRLPITLRSCTLLLPTGWEEAKTPSCLLVEGPNGLCHLQPHSSILFPYPIHPSPLEKCKSK